MFHGDARAEVCEVLFKRESVGHERHHGSEPQTDMVAQG